MAGCHQLAIPALMKRVRKRKFQLCHTLPILIKHYRKRSAAAHLLNLMKQSNACIADMRWLPVHDPVFGFNVGVYGD